MILPDKTACERSVVHVYVFTCDSLPQLYDAYIASGSQLPLCCRQIKLHVVVLKHRRARGHHCHCSDMTACDKTKTLQELDTSHPVMQPPLQYDWEKDPVLYYFISS